MENNDYIIEIAASDICEWVRCCYVPEEVYDSTRLGIWAEANGYVKAEALQ